MALVNDPARVTVDEGLASIQAIDSQVASKIDPIIWIFLVIAAMVCASSQRLSIVIASIPLSIVSIIWGVQVFDPAIFDVGALAVGVIIAATAFGFSAERRKELTKKEQQHSAHEEDYQE